MTAQCSHELNAGAGHRQGSPGIMRPPSGTAALNATPNLESLKVPGLWSGLFPGGN